ncbi:MAG TPA: hypothetical protein VGN34_08615 [Ktedonobacteraceae bacterium]
MPASSSLSTVTDSLSATPTVSSALETTIPSVLTDEATVAHWERLHGRVYGSREWGVQLHAAHTLLGMELPASLSLDLLQRLYETYLDDFWKEKYGQLHLSHLIETEHSSGQVWVVRWMHRLQFQVVKRGWQHREQAGEERFSMKGQRSRRVQRWPVWSNGRAR